MPPKIQRSIWELILMHLPSTKMLAQYLVEVLSTALNSLVAGLTSLKIWSTKSAKKRHLCASISAHSLHRVKEGFSDQLEWYDYTSLGGCVIPMWVHDQQLVLH